MGKSKIIYIPSFEDCLIRRKELFDWEYDIGWDYYTSFREAKMRMIDYWKSAIQDAQINLKTAREIKIEDCAGAGEECR
jgi:hypothetical protein